MLKHPQILITDAIPSCNCHGQNSTPTSVSDSSGNFLHVAPSITPTPRGSIFHRSASCISSFTESSFFPITTPTPINFEYEDPRCCCLGEWIMGDSQKITDYLDQWSNCSIFYPLKLFNVIARSFGNPVLVNNIFGGFIVMISIALDDFIAFMWALLGSILGYLCLLIIQEKSFYITNGPVVPNSMLIGLFLGRSFDKFVEEYSLRSFVFLIIVSCTCSVFLTKAMANWMSSVNLPTLTISYAVLGILTMLNFEVTHEKHLYRDKPQENCGRLDVFEVAENIAMATGHVYHMTTFHASCLIWVALIVYSPLATIQGIIGASTGYFLGFLLPGSCDTQGFLSQAAFLTQISIGGMFFVQSITSTCIGIFGSCVATFIFHAFNKTKTPCLTIPHIITTWIFLGIKLPHLMLRRIDLAYITFPEMHKTIFS